MYSTMYCATFRCQVHHCEGDCSRGEHSIHLHGKDKIQEFFLYLQRLHPNAAEHKRLEDGTVPATAFDTVSFAHHQYFVDRPEITYQ